MPRVTRNAVKRGNTKKNKTSMSVQTRTVPAARGEIVRFHTPGLSDIQGMRIQYLANTVYTGNGGSTFIQYVYPTTVVGGNLQFYYGSAMAILPGETAYFGLGQSYISDIMKHFSWMRYRQIRLHFSPAGLGSQTNAGVTVVWAPRRGGNVSMTYDITTCAHNNTSSGSLLANKGAEEFPAWEKRTLDLTPYIGGGRGPSGYEFATDTSTGSASINSNDLGDIAPASYWLSGNVANAGAGLAIGHVFVEMVVDFLDFQFQNENGNISGLNRAAAPAKAAESQLKADEPPLCRPALIRQSAVDCSRIAAAVACVDDSYVRVPTNTPTAQGRVLRT